MKTQWRIAVVGLAVGFFFAALPVKAQIPKLAEMPPRLPAAVLAELNQTRATLVQRRDALQARGRAFNAKCADVTAGTALAAECEREQKAIEAERAAYIRLVNAFNTRARVQHQLTQPAGRLLNVKGDVRVETPDGRSVAGADLGAHTLTSGSRIRLGPDSHATFRLMDDSTLTLGPGSELVVDEFVYDPATGSGKRLAQLTRGAFRFVTGKIAPRSPEESWEFHLCGAYAGIRGTEFEALVRPDNSGHLKLFSGKVELRPPSRERKVLLEAGQMISFDAVGGLGTPAPIR